MKKKTDEKQRFFDTLNFVTMMSINLFYCCKRVFTLMMYGSLRTIRGTSLPEKEEYYSNLNMEDIMDVVTRRQKEFIEILK